MILRLITILVYGSATIVHGGILDRIRQCNSLKDTCNFCQDLTENNIDTAHAWHFKNSEHGQEQRILPVSNLHLAMRGIDTFDRNTKGSTKAKSMIFDPLEVSEGKTYVNSFVETISTDVDCNNDVYIPNLNGDEINALFLGNFSQDYDMMKNVSNLRNKYGNKTLVAEMECVTAEVKISPFEEPKFTKSFVSALKILNEAAYHPTSPRSRETAFTFFKTYGTHFSVLTRMGAKVRFVEELDNEPKKELLGKLEECFKKQSRKSVEDGKGKHELTVTKYKSNIKSCGDLSSGTDTRKASPLTVFGSLPRQTLNTWSTDAIENPVPVSVRLMKMSHLFRQSWLDTITEVGETVLNADLMYKYFQFALSEYCSAFYGTTCDRKKTTGKFRNEILNDQSTSEYAAPKRKDVRTVTSGIIMQGGYDQEIRKMSSAEVISTALAVNLPDTPEGMGGHSLAALNSTLYSCGSCTPWQITSTLRTCYKLDMSEENSTWVSSTGLPSAINNYHLALTVSGRIWYFTLESSKVFVFESEEGVFVEHLLPFTYSIHGCIVGDSYDRAYYVDTLNSHIYSMLDARAPERWLRFNLELKQQYHFPCCLLLGFDLLVTGGNSTRQLEHFHSINTRTRSVRPIDNFNHDRKGYSLFILDGRPAVAGGVFDRVLGSIETYDFKKDQWSPHLATLSSPRAYYAITPYSYPIQQELKFLH